MWPISTGSGLLWLRLDMPAALSQAVKDGSLVRVTGMVTGVALQGDSILALLDVHTVEVKGEVILEGLDVSEESEVTDETKA